MFKSQFCNFLSCVFISFVIFFPLNSLNFCIMNTISSLCGKYVLSVVRHWVYYRPYKCFIFSQTDYSFLYSEFWATGACPLPRWKRNSSNFSSRTSVLSFFDIKIPNLFELYSDGLLTFPVANQSSKSHSVQSLLLPQSSEMPPLSGICLGLFLISLLGPTGLSATHAAVPCCVNRRGLHCLNIW